VVPRDQHPGVGANGQPTLNMQFAAGSALASLDGWKLVFRCPKCREKEKPAADLVGDELGQLARLGRRGTR
jgi:hypothetical protein